MLSTRRNAVYFLIITCILFYGWIFLFWNNDVVRTLGTLVFPIIGGTVSFIWLLKTYLAISNTRKYFWLLFSIAVCMYTIGHIILLYDQFNHTWQIPFELLSIIWIFACILFLTALLLKAKWINLSFVNSPYIFNIIIFFTIALSISLHYIINPLFSQSSITSISEVSWLIYSVVNLSILFVSTGLYYLSRNGIEKQLLLLIVVSFFIKTIGDVLFVYLISTGNYELGSIVDSFWFFFILIIGFAGRYRTKYNSDQQWEAKKYTKHNETIFSYMIIGILALLVMNSYRWNFNTLSIGITVVFGMVIVRQFYIMKKNEQLVNKLVDLASHDPLTKLMNRGSFQENLTVIMKQAKNRNRTVALLLLDLDRFKNVNDSLGHYIGDCILIESSKRLNKTLNTYDSIYRLGGDEFVIILPDATKERCISVAEQILDHFNTPFKVNNYEIVVTPSIGICIYPLNGESEEALLKNADTAMYLAKEKGKNNYQFFNSKMDEVISRRIVIETELRKAISNNQLSLNYQPKVELNSGKIIGLEALLRWEHPELKFISPVEFIPVAEETGQIVSIGEWVLKEACKQTKIWHNKGFKDICISVNVSVRQFQHNNFVGTVSEVLKETGLEAHYLELEITESIMQNFKESTEVIKGLREIGVRTSMDDFGTGYSSLSILNELPIDTIKIDKSFLTDIFNYKKLSMVKTIVDIGSNLDLKVIAEGIENVDQVRVLSDFNCYYGQGYYFSKPIESSKVEALLELEAVSPFS